MADDGQRVTITMGRATKALADAVLLAAEESGLDASGVVTALAGAYVAAAAGSGLTPRETIAVVCMLVGVRLDDGPPAAPVTRTVVGGRRSAVRRRR